MRTLAAVVALAACVAVAHAEPPPGAEPDSAIAKWVHTIRKRSTGSSCCSAADCRPTSIRADEDGKLQAWIGKDEYGPDAPDAWQVIPRIAIDNTIADGPSPDGRSWVCWWNGSPYCAVLSELF